MNLVNKLAAKHSALPKLVQKDNFVGWTYQVGFDTVKVLTNDAFKRAVRGIPHNAFLVATSFDPEKFMSVDEFEQEVLLLRVVGSCPLPHDNDLTRIKVDSAQAIKDKFEMVEKTTDTLTQGQIQYGGLECRILGTFYMQEGVLHLGSDQETFSASARLKVFRPKGDALRLIVNHVDPVRIAQAEELAKAAGMETTPEPIRIGDVRYTSTARLHRAKEEELVPVTIFPQDFLARRTAVLGMSRTGKSNTVKTMVSVVKAVAEKSGVKIGQIIYDINGEYANANQQDKGSIADMFPKDTVRYRMVKTPGFEELQNNFYLQLVEGHSLISQVLREDRANKPAGDVEVFLNASLEEPDPSDVGEHKRWEVRAAAFRALLHKAEFEPPDNFKVKFPANEEVVDAVKKADASCKKHPAAGLTLDEAVEWFQAARKANQAATLKSSSGKDWLDTETLAMLNMLAGLNQNNTYIRGFKVLVPARDYHSARRAKEVGDEVYAHLVGGKIVILDLSVGDPMLRDRLSKQIAAEIFKKSMGTFITGKTPPNVMIFVEEAHNLLGRGMELTDVWPRIAKEGSKYRIGLVFATQEVTSMHPNILANTENWFVTHINNANEVKELSKFYDFDDFSASLIQAQDVGFARVKTLSSPFVIPVQISKFDPNGQK